MQVKLATSWKNALKEEFEKPYFKGLAEFVRGEYLSSKVYPPPKLVFNALERCSLDDVKVVILGQDPYHGEGQAHGLSFSVPDGVRSPPSLQNIYKEMVTDVGGGDASMPTTGNLERWTDQGVLLLNATLTVRAGQAGSHQKKGWETFTDEIIRKVSQERGAVAFVLWGAFARSKKDLIDREKHLIVESPHPSPFSAHYGFFGSKPFSRVNAWLESQGETPIHWL